MEIFGRYSCLRRLGVQLKSQADYLYEPPRSRPSARRFARPPRCGCPTALAAPPSGAPDLPLWARSRSRQCRAACPGTTPRYETFRGPTHECAATILHAPCQSSTRPHPAGCAQLRGMTLNLQMQADTAPPLGNTGCPRAGNACAHVRATGQAAHSSNSCRPESRSAGESEPSTVWSHRRGSLAPAISPGRHQTHVCAGPIRLLAQLIPACPGVRPTQPVLHRWPSNPVRSR